jgi:hypothetical protein
MENEQEVSVVNELIVKVLSNGAININYPEGQPELPPSEVERIAKYIYENLRDERIAQKALDMFKARLG